MEELVRYLPGILVAYGAFFFGILSPGPNILAVIGTSMGRGRRFGKALAMGVATGSCIWGLLTWLGLTSLLSLYASAITVIKVMGAAYLLFLAFKAFRSAAAPGDPAPRALASEGSCAAYFRRGLLIQLTNPKAALTWVAIMSLGTGVSSPWWVGAAIVIGTTLLSTVGHLSYAVAFSTAPMVGTYKRARRWIEAGLGAFFCFASYKLLTSRT